MAENYAFDNFDQLRDEWRQRSLGDFFKRMLQTPSQAGAQGGNPMANAQAMGAKGFDDSEAFPRPAPAAAEPSPMSFPDSLAALAGAGHPAGDRSGPVDIYPDEEQGPFSRHARPAPSPSKAAAKPPQKLGPPSPEPRLNGFNRSHIGDVATQQGPKPTPAPKPTQHTPFSADPMSGAMPGQGGGGFMDFFTKLFGSPTGLPTHGGPSGGPGFDAAASFNPQPAPSAQAGRPTTTSMRYPVPPGYKPGWGDPVGAWRQSVWGDQPGQ